VVRCAGLDEMLDKAGVVPLRAEDRLREAIVTGRLQPNVEHERHRGARVRLVRQDEAVEILEARAVLEALAARLAAERATGDDVEDLKTILA
jgi:DNA-binding GntR family transcriptional regulator